MRVVDLTQPWGDRMPTWPQFASIEVTDITTHHRDRKSTVLVKTNMHTGTHIDAPIHYAETGKHLGEIPLADLVGTGLVIAEFYTSIAGLGYMIVKYANSFQTDKLFVPIVVLMVMGVVLMEALKQLQGRMAPWLRQTDEE